MKKRVRFLIVIAVFIIAIAGCKQKISVDEKEDFGCFPSSCSSILDTKGQKMCKDWKANKKIEWPPDCNYLPTEECRKLCNFEKSSAVSTQQIQPQKDITSVDDMSQSALLELCKKYPLPPDCSFISEPDRKLFCERCKEIFPQESSTTSGQHTEQSEDNRRKIILELPSCDTKKEFFNTTPASLSQIDTITPLGNLNPSGHTFPTDHVYFTSRSGGEISIFSPGDVWITSIRSSETEEASGEKYTDYAIYFSPCQEFLAYFFHIDSLSQKIKEKFIPPYDRCDESTTGGSRYKTCEKNIKIELKSGEVIGQVTGKSGHTGKTFDFGASDLRTNALQYTNPARWQSDKLHVICPFDYFIPSVGDSLKAKLGGWDGKPRTAQPICGEVEQDEAGTAQGVWFIKGTIQTYPEDPHLALVHDNIDPAKGVFSVGTSINGLSSGTYSFNPASSGVVNRDFKDITADGKVYCYEAQGGRPYTQYVAVILQLTSSTTLRIEKQNSNNCGNGPWAFSFNYVDFER